MERGFDPCTEWMATRSEQRSVRGARNPVINDALRDFASSPPMIALSADQFLHNRGSALARAPLIHEYNKRKNVILVSQYAESGSVLNRLHFEVNRESYLYDERTPMLEDILTRTRKTFS
ncbi:hypothetical protein J6590_014966 [Homalodisca vitripennis]|nr:hypothetical protein J6590_014966 [Homalodisca vitripennis]